MSDILAKFGAVPYVPGKKIPVMIPENKLLILDQALKGQLTDRKDSA